jgi:hypothetical protein
MRAATKAIAEGNLAALKAAFAKVENKNGVCFASTEFLFGA